MFDATSGDSRYQCRRRRRGHGSVVFGGKLGHQRVPRLLVSS